MATAMYKTKFGESWVCLNIFGGSTTFTCMIPMVLIRPLLPVTPLSYFAISVALVISLFTDIRAVYDVVVAPLVTFTASVKALTLCIFNFITGEQLSWVSFV